MGIHVRKSKERINAINQQITYRVLHVFGFVVDLIPRKSERAHKKKFDQTVPLALAPKGAKTY